MLHGGHVYGLEKPGSNRRDYADTVYDTHVHDPGDAKMVYLEGKSEDVAKVSSMVARQERGYHRRIDHDREDTSRVPRKRTKCLAEHILGVDEEEQSQAASHLPRNDVVPADVRYQCSDILHGTDFQGMYLR